MSKLELGCLGESHVAEKLLQAGFDVELLGGTTPYFDIMVQRDGSGMIKVQVKTWASATNDSKIASVDALRKADVYVFVRADDPQNLRAYVYQASEIAPAVRIADTAPNFPFTRDPGIKSPTGVGYWARKNWLFCESKRLNAWSLMKRLSQQQSSVKN